MPKLMTAIMAAAFIAAVITVLSAPTAHVDASPPADRGNGAIAVVPATPMALSALRRHALRQSTRAAGQQRPAGRQLAAWPHKGRPKHCLGCAVHCLLLWHSGQRWNFALDA